MTILSEHSISILFFTIMIPETIAYPTTIKSIKINSPTKHNQFPTTLNEHGAKVSKTEINPSMTSDLPKSDLESPVDVSKMLSQINFSGIKSSAQTPERAISTTTEISSTFLPHHQIHSIQGDRLVSSQITKENSQHSSIMLTGISSSVKPPITTSNYHSSIVDQIHAVTESHNKFVEAPIASTFIQSLNFNDNEKDAQETTISTLQLLQQQFSSMAKAFHTENLTRPRAFASTYNKKDGRTSKVKLSNKPKRKRKRHRTKSNILGCGNFVCLLQKYELLKTFKNGKQDGFFLESQKLKLPKKYKKCKSFKCWINKFTITKKTDGYLLKFKPSEKAVNTKDDATSKDTDAWNFHRPLNVPEIFQSIQITKSQQKTMPENTNETEQNDL